jgi:hypothetical protein
MNQDLPWTVVATGLFTLPFPTSQQAKKLQGRASREE